MNNEMVKTGTMATLTGTTTKGKLFSITAEFVSGSADFPTLKRTDDGRIIMWSRIVRDLDIQYVTAQGNRGYKTIAKNVTLIYNKKQ